MHDGPATLRNVLTTMRMLNLVRWNISTRTKSSLIGLVSGDSLLASPGARELHPGTYGKPEAPLQMVV